MFLNWFRNAEKNVPIMLSRFIAKVEAISESIKFLIISVRFKFCIMTYTSKTWFTITGTKYIVGIVIIRINPSTKMNAEIFSFLISFFIAL